MAEETRKITDIEVDLKEVEKKLEEMKIKDIEISAGRQFKPGGVMSIAVYLVGLAMSIFHIYILTIRAIDPWYFRTASQKPSEVLPLPLGQKTSNVAHPTRGVPQNGNQRSSLN